jgi:hypothetical protein
VRGHASRSQEQARAADPPSPALQPQTLPGARSRAGQIALADCDAHASISGVRLRCPVTGHGPLNHGPS